MKHLLSTDRPRLPAPPITGGAPTVIIPFATAGIERRRFRSDEEGRIR